MKIIATASRPETRQWCLDLGAHLVIDHSKPLSGELKAAGVGQVDMVISLTQTESSTTPEIVESLKPQGQFALIDDMPVLDAMKLKPKSISLHWESMFTRSTFGPRRTSRSQGALLAEVAALVDAGIHPDHAQQNASAAINAANLRAAHALQIESGRSQGKVVLEGF